MKLRLAGITPESVVDGPGVRFTIFAQGCEHQCSGCHNPATHSFTGGKLFKIEEIIEQIKEKTLITGVTFTGGDPFFQAAEFAQLGQEIKELEQELDIITYTGFLYEDLIQDQEWLSLLKVTDILVDGLFDEEKEDLNLNYRGSSNQRVIDVKESLATDKIIELKL
ncbi:anaerobic ribonucleoside-triphosphate reductase activating protein [Natroniella sulfidigena]|uniref:anaerobic ribonucleoside-triphosphate reductase activating protein n=1 Tax=Natroniella sulfidigena TaxID=723921 RepID=UPI00200AB8AD|nr:anaerobic ribonucleoside-triphosphate reductase activating protein [Natroniella sulfidigena]MCK8817967.1 anaerobic ribonucleoside-triphosphate reductase activating protein [Natroniella sulfidigena]